MGKSSGGQEVPPVTLLLQSLDELGGISSRYNRMANELAARGVEVRLVGLHSPETKANYSRVPGVRVLQLEAEKSPRQRWLRSRPRRWAAGVAYSLLKRRVRGRPSSPRTNARSVAELTKVVAGASEGEVFIVPEFVVLQHLWEAIEDGGRTKDLRVVAQWPASFGYAEKRNLVTQLINTFERAEALVALTKEDGDQFLERGLRNATWISNPSREPRTEVRRVSNRDKVVVLMSRIEEGKGVGDAIAAWSLVAKALPDWRLEIHGEGSLSGKMKRRVDQLGLAESVRFLGYANDPLGVLEDARLHLSSSLDEGWGNSISEANSVGTPTVAYDCSPGVRAQVEDGANGRLVETGNVVDLAKAIVDSARNLAGLEDMSAICLEVAQRTAPDRIYGEWLALVKRGRV